MGRMATQGSLRCLREGEVAAVASPHITEPMTMVTDYLLAAQCLVQPRVLSRRAPTMRLGSIPVWVAAFVGTAIAALAGGTVHGATSKHLRTCPSKGLKGRSPPG